MPTEKKVKNNTDKKEVKEKSPVVFSKKDYSLILKEPRITEKATMLSENGAYTFNVPKDTTKNEIKKAIFSIYKVSPEKVRVVTIKAKNIIFRGKKGTKKGGKKAYVYLKKGDKIDFV
ncbi:MAG: 50S ribosomal protein L23 [Candidatus Paceibacterota bacterium]|jgi:large subunit ribosomal protein L23